MSTTKTSIGGLPGYDRWLEKPYRDRDPVTCPHCGEDIDPNSEECEHCGAYVGHENPDPDSMPGGHDNPTDYDEFGSPQSRFAVTSKFHILGQDGQLEQPGKLDHSRVDQMSQAQEGAHQRLVNYAVEKLNEAITEGGAIDESFLQNLQLDITNQFGVQAQEAQTIVDLAMRQTQNQDQTLDTLQPQPVEQSAEPANPQAPGVGQGPEPVPVANGAFAKTARGLTGTVTDSWLDVWGDQWFEVTDRSGFRESVHATDVQRVDEKTAAAPISEATEILAFLQETEPKSFIPTEVHARIANLKLAREEIRRLIANDKVEPWEKMALDKMNDDAAVELMNLTDALPGLTQHAPLEEQLWDVFERPQPTMHGIEELADLGEIEPEYAAEDIAAAIPEEAQVFAVDHEGIPESALLSMAASHIDKITAGHPADVRGQFQFQFVGAVKTVVAAEGAPGYDTWDETRGQNPHPDRAGEYGPADLMGADEPAAGEAICPYCGSNEFSDGGQLGSRQHLKCRNCGSWFSPGQAVRTDEDQSADALYSGDPNDPADGRAPMHRDASVHEDKELANHDGPAEAIFMEVDNG